MEDTLSADMAVLPPMADVMGVDLLVNENSQAWLLHDQPLEGILKWVEYDVEMGTLTLLDRDGRIQSLGLELTEEVGTRLSGVMQIYVIYMKEGAVGDFAMVPVIVHGATVH